MTYQSNPVFCQVLILPGDEPFVKHSFIQILKSRAPFTHSWKHNQSKATMLLTVSQFLLSTFSSYPTSLAYRTKGTLNQVPYSHLALARCFYILYPVSLPQHAANSRGGTNVQQVIKDGLWSLAAAAI